MAESDLNRKYHLLEQRLLQKAREMSLLKEMSLFLTDSVQKALDLLAYRIGVLTDAKFVRLYLADKSCSKLSLVSGYNLSEKYLEMVKDRFEVSIESVPCGKAVIERVPYIVNDVTRDDLFASWSSIAALHGYSSYVAFPLMVHDRIVGAVDVFFEHVRYFSDDEINLMAVLCNVGALAVENAMLIEKVSNVSIMDEETGAFNSRHFRETLRREVERAKRYSHPLCVIEMTVRTSGEASEGRARVVAGQQEMASFVSAVKNRTRGSDLLFRCSDNVFCMILAQTARQATDVVIARVRAVFGEIVGQEAELEISLLSLPEDGDTAEEVMKRFPGEAGRA